MCFTCALKSVIHNSESGIFNPLSEIRNPESAIYRFSNSPNKQKIPSQGDGIVSALPPRFPRMAGTLGRRGLMTIQKIPAGLFATLLPGSCNGENPSCPTLAAGSGRKLRRERSSATAGETLSQWLPLSLTVQPEGPLSVFAFSLFLSSCHVFQARITETFYARFRRSPGGLQKRP